MTAKLTVRQEVPVRTPHGSYTGVVTRVGRKIATIYYIGRHAEFDMATRRQKIKQVGVGYFYELPDSDPEQERFCAALDVLEAHGITVAGGADVTPDQVEAIAAILNDQPEGD